MRSCPLCGAKVEAKYPDMIFMPSVKKWCFSHSCHHDQNLEHTSFLSVYGDTEQEVIDRWNGVQHEDEESESL